MCRHGACLTLRRRIPNSPKPPSGMTSSVGSVATPVVEIAVMTVADSTVEEYAATCTSASAEHGGIAGGPRRDHSLDVRRLGASAGRTSALDTAVRDGPGSDAWIVNTIRQVL